MKLLIVKYIIPLTIILFITVTKWWYVLVIDGTDEMMCGFPLIYICRGFHTSLSHQFFAIEFTIDFLCYFIVTGVMVFVLNKFFNLVKAHKFISKTLWGLASILIILSCFVLLNNNNRFHLKRPFDVKVMDNGIDFVWQNEHERNYNNYIKSDN